MENDFWAPQINLIDNAVNFFNYEIEQHYFQGD